MTQGNRILSLQSRSSAIPPTRSATTFTHLLGLRSLAGHYPSHTKWGRVARASEAQRRAGWGTRVASHLHRGPHPSRRYRGEPPSPASRGRDKRSIGASSPAPLEMCECRSLRAGEGSARTDICEAAAIRGRCGPVGSGVAKCDGPAVVALPIGTPSHYAMLHLPWTAAGRRSSRHRGRAGEPAGCEAARSRPAPGL